MLTPLWVYGNTQSCEINEKFLKVEAGNGKCVALIFIHNPPVSLVNSHVYISLNHNLSYEYCLCFQSRSYKCFFVYIN